MAAEVMVVLRNEENGSLSHRLDWSAYSEGR